MTSRTFNDQQHANCFVGLVDSVDDLGVWITQLSTGKKSFFAAPVIGIIEETFRSLTDEEADAAKARLTIPQQGSTSDNNNYIQPEQLTKDWKKFKETKYNV